jgi:hypothetical protein
MGFQLQEGFYWFAKVMRLEPAVKYKLLDMLDLQVYGNQYSTDKIEI